MGEITIYFVGICTHVENKVPGVPHRVVLVHEEENVVINGFTIASHLPGVDLRPRDVRSGSVPISPLRQILHVANARGDAPSYDEHYRCAIPSLEKLAGKSLALDECVVIEREHPATMYFDVTHGRFSACTVPHSATGAILTIETEGDPQLILTPMDDGGEPAAIALHSGAVVMIRNEATGLRDHTDADFLLHYEIVRTEDVPLGSPFPQEPTTCRGLPVLPDLDIDLGPGCSNSHYP